jgi:Uma2 family endonuclease
MSEASATLRRVSLHRQGQGGDDGQMAVLQSRPPEVDATMPAGLHIEPGASALEIYEELARIEHLHVELLFGRIVVTGSASARHNWIVHLLNMMLMTLANANGWGLLGSQTLHIQGTGDRPKPDVAVVPRFGAPKYDPNEYYGHGVLLAAEVVSPSSKADDRRDKARMYAQGRVPLYLLIDDQARPPAVTLFSNPVDGRYLSEQTVPVGGRLALPEPFGVVLDTAELRVPE